MTGKKLFEAAFTEASGTKIPAPKTSDWLIETAVACSEADYLKKTLQMNYFRANAAWFLEEMERIIQTIPSDESYQSLSVSYGQALSFVHSLIIDSLALLTDCTYLKSGSVKNGLYKNPNTGMHEFYMTARYLMYGSFVTGHHSDVSISVIRQALELRIRRAFGVIAKIDAAETQFPVSLSEIIRAMEPFEKNITMPISLPKIKRINGWANMYLHSGIKEYSWVAPRVLDYLFKFLIGGDPAPGFYFTINSGVITDKKTFESIRSSLEHHCGKDFRLLVANEEHCAVVIRSDQ